MEAIVGKPAGPKAPETVPEGLTRGQTRGQTPSRDLKPETGALRKGDSEQWAAGERVQSSGC
jgi:hypothetical protein